MDSLTEQQRLLCEEVLSKPLFAHLSTVEKCEPRESPVWFIWDNKSLWFIGNYKTDSFPKRIEENGKCAIGIVEYDVTNGIVKHIGFRGYAYLEKADNKIIKKLFHKYMGEENNWHPRFKSVLGNTDYVLIRFEYQTIVARDQSY
ncbi:pyridoxamine 5'-phosphate oxidase family protein [Mammaliicoccus sciuri]|uniref:pyridoxamine 5'-phosphate oxidase family protein n=1 Tax=Mammaliicoccus TaxID=2803850 RepID=UPI0019530700|nr:MULTISPECIES: pyridoxamine 5'-phosphate oxidase family protein [Mammaliicoccus]MCJ0919832.1 pyridoxamine 5'-phosphate oxidase family protein [Mammaliicoccus sciuri]MCJ0957659.1 pyridoxamine 5'-phosphate oxidase family protein [Mammaliicoccus sciuri]MCJ0962675.1 pyridoxamine 5'-phosphate oxidase family protein [Mammaliicoccus sciuri]MCJ1763984.1 pyridoxamine 5'-phosphate oxidase family protein [Mammaliicoccus sciuri]MCJ1772767.1 pyridoxamine 5'-phosphate oxidase family protein [Mammaliicoccu